MQKLGLFLFQIPISFIGVLFFTFYSNFPVKDCVERCVFFVFTCALGLRWSLHVSTYYHVGIMLTEFANT